jgi:hypothetical protein
MVQLFNLIKSAMDFHEGFSSLDTRGEVEYLSLTARVLLKR